MDLVSVSLDNDEWTQVIAALEVRGNPLAKKVMELVAAAPIKPSRSGMPFIRDHTLYRGK